MTDDTVVSRFSRRRMVAGTIGAGLATATVFQFTRAQVDTGTPEASPTTGNTSIEDPDTAINATVSDDATTAIEWATEAITTAQADRDTVATQIDATTIDSLLTQATSLRDRAQQAADGGDSDGALRLAAAAWGTARTAGDLVKAQLTYAGLPSQEAPASRVLANAYEMVQAVSEDAGDSTDTDVSFSISTAQTLYGSAYELYTGGAYAQASVTARASAELGRVAWALAGGSDELRLLGPRDGGLPGPFGPGDFHGADPRAGRRIRAKIGDRIGTTDADASERNEPVTVPEPNFS
ncbi:MAG: hypothetical protein M3N47_14265 [Chloroflexota bacterium]|nr:hypothetical protein [Chloroflexota bacterium]